MHWYICHEVIYGNNFNWKGLILIKKIGNILKLFGYMAAL